MQRTDLRFPTPRPAGDASASEPAAAAGRDQIGGGAADRSDGAPAPGVRRSRGRVFLRRVRRFVALLLCAVLAVIAGTAARVWWVARQDARPTVDAILVLGASQYDGRPSPVLRARLEHAVALYREGVAPRIITVGGNQPGDRFTEADSGRRWLIAHEVAETSVLAVPEGRDTLQSVRAVRDLMRRHQWRSVVIVTDPWHALRSRSMARAEGLNASVSPARQGPAVRSRSTQGKYVARETAAWLHWWLLRRSSGFGHGVV
ncbi:YdcF family protein [Yinghuangia soli]|uniref:YdcF family protein n=1 Tax=Yinghuangia soli TaxID=2908204 RepID=A0AA41Q1U9_9ACTN|nr:YdcF family protein [Yinghuangia soli]MCF2528537.1 YdcF family protein [Yinghuangia soli]